MFTLSPIFRPPADAMMLPADTLDMCARYCAAGVAQTRRCHLMPIFCLRRMRRMRSRYASARCAADARHAIADAPMPLPHDVAERCADALPRQDAQICRRQRCFCRFLCAQARHAIQPFAPFFAFILSAPPAHDFPLRRADLRDAARYANLTSAVMLPRQQHGSACLRRQRRCGRQRF